MFKKGMLIIGCFLLASLWWAKKDPAATVTEKLLAKKDISSYAGSDMALTVRELEFPPAYDGTKHRHPGPVVVCVLEGSLEISLEGQPAQTYNRGQCFSEEPHQLHIYTRNTSKTQPARIISYILSRNGEPLTQPGK
jgi:quercetin dioxygenase-like cupin family protein